MTSVEITNGWGFAEVLVIVAAVVLVIVLGYKIIRGESLIHRTRLGIFVERDRFPDDDDENDETAIIPPRRDE